MDELVCRAIFAQIPGMIPFSPPRIDDETVSAVSEALRSGWITTGPRTKQFERDLADYLNSPRVICLNSWTNAVALAFRWFGIGPGDEVIVPGYTYAASANIILHLGATPVLADCAPGSFNSGPEQIAEKLSPRTKAVMPVDIGGFPSDVDGIAEVVASAPFTASNPIQEKLGRPLFVIDAAHSFGARYKQAAHGSKADIVGFSFHAVKNLTTAEGGALSLNLPDSFDVERVYSWLNTMSLHGQSKDALAKTSTGAWRYDIIEPGFKCNMTDLQAAIGQVELGRYDETLARRKQICLRYQNAFSDTLWAMLPTLENEAAESSYHLYMLRLANCSESQRDSIIQKVYENEVAVNVHFQPLPLLTAYRERGYLTSDLPFAMEMYSNEISLPVYYDLSDGQVDQVIKTVKTAVEEVLG